MSRQRWCRGDRSDVIGVLDIGTSKVACLIVACEHDGNVQALGLGHHRSRGMKAGVIVDLDEAERAVRAAVAQAEDKAGLTLESVFVAVSCGRLATMTVTGHAELASGFVTDHDIARLHNGARTFAERDGRRLVLLTGTGYCLDGLAGIRDLRGMAGHRLCMDLEVVTADAAPLRNLELLIERSYLSVAGLVPSALASALATTSAEERRHGVICLDIGGGATTMAGFSRGSLTFTDAIPVGGNHVTFDLARTLVAPIAESERIKTLYATLACAASDEHELISYPFIGKSEPTLYQTSRARIGGIVRSRIEKLLLLVRERLESGADPRPSGVPVVLTGGTSELLGLGPYAAQVLGRPVRVARPTPLPGVPESVSSPAFSTVMGLVAAARSPNLVLSNGLDKALRGEGYLGRMERWIRASF